MKHFPRVSGWRRVGVLMAALGAGAPAAASTCGASSPAHTVALVELYTSEGCSSCPPADRWLSSLRGAGFRRDQVVPLALHVDYWNHLGWTDPFSDARFSARQRRAAGWNRLGFVYTPQLMLQGRDFAAWSNGARFAEALAGINQRPAGADLALRLASDPGRLTLTLHATVVNPTAHPDAQLFVALYQNQLSTRVSAGENAGRTLHHDHVVRAWHGPIKTGSDGRVALNQAFQLDAGWQPAQLGVAAFVQDPHSSEVLQALALPACP